MGDTTEAIPGMPEYVAGAAFVVLALMSVGVLCTHRYSFVAFVALPVGWITLFFLTISTHSAYFGVKDMPVPPKVVAVFGELASVFNVKKLKLSDALLAALLILTSYAFSIMVNGIERLTVAVEQTGDQWKRLQPPSEGASAGRASGDGKPKKTLTLRMPEGSGDIGMMIGAGARKRGQALR
eukprot:Hpha_TRINITY_DN2641_c0_g1::TRINITY_DN2641_c0_g1_i1::g.145855::m.145855